MKYLQTYKIFEKKKHKLKRLSEEQFKKEVEKNDGKQPQNCERVEGIKTDEKLNTFP